MSARLRRAVCFLLLACWPDGVRADVGDPDAFDLRVAFGTIERGSWIRITRRDGGRVEGSLDAATGHAVGLVPLDAEPLWIPLREVARVERRTRSTRAWGRTGAVIGVVAGGFFGLVANGLCGVFGDPCPQAIPILAGSLGLSGLVAGRVIGSAVPEWTLAYEARASGAPGPEAPAAHSPVVRPETSRPPVPRRWIGGARVIGGFGAGTDARAPGGGAGGRISLIALWTSRIGVGPEIAYHDLGAGERSIEVHGAVRVAALGAGHDPARSARLELLASAGFTGVKHDLGRYTGELSGGRGTEEVSLLGGSIGIAFRAPLRSHIALVAEVRRGGSLQNLALPRSFGFVQFGAGVERLW